MLMTLRCLFHNTVIADELEHVIKWSKANNN